LVFLNSSEVAVQGHVGVAVFKHCARELFDFAEERRFPAQVMPSGGRGFDAAAY
jgi:hypothetical protein